MALKPEMEFWFDFGSNYSYLCAMRIEQLAADAGVQVAWKPFLLGPIFKSFGWASSPFVLQKEKGAYVWRDMERECARHGVPFRKPSAFPRGSVLGHRVAVAAAAEPWLPDFCRTLFQRNFVADLDIEGVEAISEVLSSIGQDSGGWIERASTDAVKQRLRAQTDEAKARGLFGAPTLMVGPEMFWGHDRLEQALAWTGERGQGRKAKES